MWVIVGVLGVGHLHGLSPLLWALPPLWNLSGKIERTRFSRIFQPLPHTTHSFYQLLRDKREVVRGDEAFPGSKQALSSMKA